MSGKDVEFCMSIHCVFIALTEMTKVEINVSYEVSFNLKHTG